MEAKKNPKQDLSRKSSYFFSIGLLVSLLAVITAFEWRSYSDPVIDLVQKKIDNFQPLLNIPLTKIEVPPPPKVRPLIFVEVKKNEKVDPVPIIDLEPDSTHYNSVLAPEPEPEPADIIFNFVEEFATPKGGNQAFYKHVSDNIKYPPQARRTGIEGKVFVQFVICKDGSVCDVKVVKGIGGGCDEEAVRVVQSAPAWNPGKQRGKPVKQRFTFPVVFKLG